MCDASKNHSFKPPASPDTIDTRPYLLLTTSGDTGILKSKDGCLLPSVALTRWHHSYSVTLRHSTETG